jgi:hypothetical protein
MRWTAQTHAAGSTGPAESSVVTGAGTVTPDLALSPDVARPQGVARPDPQTRSLPMYSADTARSGTQNPLSAISCRCFGLQSRGSGLRNSASHRRCGRDNGSAGRSATAPRAPPKRRPTPGEAARLPPPFATCASCRPPSSPYYGKVAVISPRHVRPPSARRHSETWAVTSTSESPRAIDGWRGESGLKRHLLFAI